MTRIQICSFQSEGRIALLGESAHSSLKPRIVVGKLTKPTALMLDKRGDVDVPSIPGSVMIMSVKSQSCRQPACLPAGLSR